MVNFDQWNGFKGRLWKEEINVRDFVQNNYKPYDEMKVSLKDLQKLLTSFGEDFRNYRRKKELRAAYLIWKQKLLLVLQLMVLDI